MNKNVQEVKLSTGVVVQCRPVPPYALQVIHEKFPVPVYPVEKIESAAGHTEVKPVLRDTPEWKQYQEDLQKYSKVRSQAVMDFSMTYSVVSWKLHDSSEWVTVPPEDWEVPEIMAHFDVTTSDDPYQKRLQFLKYELIQRDSDLLALDAVAADMQPLTKKEVEAAKAPFESKGQTDSP
jgi:hypothetical protein